MRRVFGPAAFCLALRRGIESVAPWTKRDGVTSLQRQRGGKLYLDAASLLADLKLDTPDCAVTAMRRNGSGHASPGIGRDLDVMRTQEEQRRPIR